MRVRGGGGGKEGGEGQDLYLAYIAFRQRACIASKAASANR